MRVAAPVAAWTATVTEPETLPPAPLQLMVNVVFAVSAPLDWLPDVPLLPNQPSDAVQVSTLLADQFRVAELP